MEQLKVDFLTMVVQELRIPLKLFSETLGLAQEGFYGPWEDPLKKKFFNELIRVRSQLGRLLLEGFALFLSHEQRVNAASIDVRKIVEQAVAEFHSSCAEQGLTLFDLPAAQVATDRVQWRPILEWLDPVMYPVAAATEPFALKPTRPCTVPLEPAPMSLRATIRPATFRSAATGRSK